MKGYSAVIVTYFQDAKHLEHMISILKNQVEFILIIDNTPGGNSGLIREENVFYFRFGENFGIAEAQNTGLKESIKLGCFRCAIFDQDSIIPNDLCNILGSDMDMLLNNAVKVICIGPRIVDVLESKVERSSSEVELQNNCFSTRQIIASGSLINLDYIYDIGFLETGLFIDAVDHEWCWRARDKGYKVCISSNVHMEHVIGLGRGNFFIWKYIICSPIRHYYQFRNTLLLLTRHYIPIKWKVRKILEIIIMPGLFLFKGPDRIERLKYMLLGVRDGLLKYSGKIR